MGNAARALLSAADWHSWTNADHWARPPTSVAAGSGPAPIVFGSNKATIAASDPCPGPQVPPAAGFGRATRSPVIAKAAPKRPRQTRMSLAHWRAGDCFTQNHPSRGLMVGGGRRDPVHSVALPVSRPPARGRSDPIQRCRDLPRIREGGGPTGARATPGRCTELRVNFLHSASLARSQRKWTAIRTQRPSADCWR